MPPQGVGAADPKGAKSLASARNTRLVALVVLLIAPAIGLCAADQAAEWHLVRTRNPQGGADAVSIMHTANTSKSDIDLAGLMIRCAEGGPEIVIVLVRPLPLRTRPRVELGKAGNETSFEATVASPGTAIVLPKDATALVNGNWQALSEVVIRVDDDKDAIRGIVPLSGLASAFKTLLASCPQL